MIQVQIGELRNHLSAYLKKVRQGVRVLIKDRDLPIGQITPISAENEEPFKAQEPADGYEGLKSLSFPEIEIDQDVVEYLLQDRRLR